VSFPSSLVTSRVVSTLKRALAAAGGIIQNSYLRAPIVAHKGSAVNIVTSADRAAEKAIQKIIRRAFPDHGFLMEESGLTSSPSPYRWVVDPLDGTVNFAHGVPIACVSIALVKGSCALAGGVLDPFRSELFLAVRGRGATLNGRRIRVSKIHRLIESLIVTGFPYDRQKRAGYYLSFVERFMQKTQGLRRLGAAALDMSYVACGRFDGYWEFNLKPWDVAAGGLLVEEAGGRISDFSGRPHRLDHPVQTLCSNGALHRSMLRMLKR
jgi:myo-inositol-1(or 4)-monophosphatase